MRIATSENGKQLTGSKTVTTPKNFEEGINTLLKIASELSKEQKITAVAGGLKGPLDKDKSISLNPPDLPDWSNKPFKASLEKALSAPIYLENDAALAGVGEATHGSGAGKNIVAYLTISTGIGGARIVNSQIDHSSLGFEPGHQIIDLNSDLVCGCGGHGHLEALIGGAAIEKRRQQKPETIIDPQFWSEVARILAIGLNNVIVHWSPDVIVLGGSVMKSIPLDKVKTHLEDVLTIFPQTPEIVPAKLGDSAGLYGALAYLKSVI